MIRPLLTGHNRFITPLANDRRPPVGRDTRARPAYNLKGQP